MIAAVMHLLGESAWWLPKWLDRILPNVDVEGAALERSHPVHGAEPSADVASGALVEGQPGAVEAAPTR